MKYEVRLKRKAIKTLTKINEPLYSNIKKAIYNLAENPRPNGYTKLKGREGYRIRVGSYRIIYDIYDSELIVEIINVGSRGGIY